MFQVFSEHLEHLGLNWIGTLFDSLVFFYFSYILFQCMNVFLFQSSLWAAIWNKSINQSSIKNTADKVEADEMWTEVWCSWQKWFWICHTGDHSAKNRRNFPSHKHKTSWFWNCDTVYWFFSQKCTYGCEKRNEVIIQVYFGRISARYDGLW